MASEVFKIAFEEKNMTIGLASSFLHLGAFSFMFDDLRLIFEIIFSGGVCAAHTHDEIMMSNEAWIHFAQSGRVVAGSMALACSADPTFGKPE